MKMRINLFMGLLLILASTSSGWAQGRLFAGSDTDEFGGLCNGRLAWADTAGPVLVTPVTLIPVPFPINGLTEAPGFLLAGQPEDLPPGCPPSPGNALREIDYNGRLILQVQAGVPPFPTQCCNEQMTESPAGAFYHAHHPDEIERVRIIAGPAQSQVVTTFPQPDVVGMTVVESCDCNNGAPSQIWISKWNGQSVGTWDPSTNTYVPRFSTPANAGGLAWDGLNGVLWVGLQGGLVQPYDCFGNVLGPGFTPFGAIGDTVDGLAFVPNPL